MILTVLEWLAYAALCVVAAQHVLGPLLVWHSQRVPERYCFRPLPDDGFMAARPVAFRERHEAMQALGFVYAGSSSLVMGQVTLFFSVYAHPHSGLAGMLVTVVSPMGELTYADFTQTYADGSVLTVCNAPVVSAYPASRYKLQFRFPAVQSLRDLLARMEGLRAAYRNDASPTPFRAETALETVALFLDREVAELVQRGWYASRVESGSRRPTLKGAALMTWRNCWPWRPLLDWHECRQANRAWAALERRPPA